MDIQAEISPHCHCKFKVEWLDHFFGRYIFLVKFGGLGFILYTSFCKPESISAERVFSVRMESLDADVSTSVIIPCPVRTCWEICTRAKHCCLFSSLTKCPQIPWESLLWQNLCWLEFLPLYLENSVFVLKLSVMLPSLFVCLIVFWLMLKQRVLECCALPTLKTFSLDAVKAPILLKITIWHFHLVLMPGFLLSQSYLESNVLLEIRGTGGQWVQVDFLETSLW